MIKVHPSFEGVKYMVILMMLIDPFLHEEQAKRQVVIFKCEMSLSIYYEEQVRSKEYIVNLKGQTDTFFFLYYLTRRTINSM